MYQVGKGDFATIRVLVEAGADLEIKSKEGYTALQETCDDRVRAYLTEAVCYTCIYYTYVLYLGRCSMRPNDTGSPFAVFPFAWGCVSVPSGAQLGSRCGGAGGVPPSRPLQLTSRA